MRNCGWTYPKLWSVAAQIEIDCYGVWVDLGGVTRGPLKFLNMNVGQ